MACAPACGNARQGAATARADRSIGLKAGAPIDDPIPMVNKFWTAVSAVLLVLGVLFYLLMALQGSATDVGVYSVTAILVAFGLAGLWAARTAPPADA